MTTIIVIVVVALVFFVSICVVSFMVWKRETEIRTDSIRAIEDNLKRLGYQLTDDADISQTETLHNVAAEHTGQRGTQTHQRARGNTGIDPFAWIRDEEDDTDRRVAKQTSKPQESSEGHTKFVVQDEAAFDDFDFEQGTRRQNKDTDEPYSGYDVADVEPFTLADLESDMGEEISLDGIEVPEESPQKQPQNAAQQREIPTASIVDAWRGVPAGTMVSTNKTPDILAQNIGIMPEQMSSDNVAGQGASYKVTQGTALGAQSSAGQNRAQNEQNIVAQMGASVSQPGASSLQSGASQNSIPQNAASAHQSTAGSQNVAPQPVQQDTLTPADLEAELANIDIDIDDINLDLPTDEAEDYGEISLDGIDLDGIKVVDTDDLEGNLEIDSGYFTDQNYRFEQADHTGAPFGHDVGRSGRKYTADELEALIKE
jgi:hypothetical protein